MNPAVVNLIGLGIIVTGIIAHIYCIAVPSYANSGLTIRVPGGVSQTLYVYFGVWEVCIEESSYGKAPPATCFTLGSSSSTMQVTVPDFVRAVQALSIIGLVVVAVAGGMSALNLFKGSRKNRMRFLPLITGGTCALGGIILLVADFVYYDTFEDFADPLSKSLIQQQFGYHLGLYWGFGLDVTASIFFIIAGGLHAVAGRVGENPGWA